MSLSQPTALLSIGNPTPKLMFTQDSGQNLLNPTYFTAMMWVRHTGGTGDAYQDIFCVRDSTIGANPGDDQIVGIVSHFNGAARVVNVGDVDTDVDGTYGVADDEWHHWTMVCEPVVGIPDQVRATGYLDAIQHVRSSDTELIPPRFPGTDCWVQLFNTRSSNTDGSSVFIGQMAGLKMWNNVALTPEEIFAEMFSYTAVKQAHLWAVLPMRDLATAGFNLLDPDHPWLVQGADFTTSVLDPPGVAWDSPYARRSTAFFFDGSIVGLVQEGYRFRFDNGAEDTATAIYAQDNPIIEPVSTNIRLRVLLDASNTDPASSSYKLEYRKNGGAWNPVVTTQPAAAMPTFVGIGAFTPGTGALSVPVPASLAQNDLMILTVESANEVVATPTGWTQVTNSPQGTGTAAAIGAVRVSVFWKIAGAGEGNVSVADAGNHTSAAVIAIRGVNTSSPIHTSAGRVDAAATFSFTAAGITTSIANCYVAVCVANDRDANATDTSLPGSSFSGTGLTTFTKRMNSETSSGVGGGVTIATAEAISPTTTGNITEGTGWLTSTTHAYLTVAIAPPAVTLEPLIITLSPNFAPGATTAQMTRRMGRTPAFSPPGELRKRQIPQPRWIFSVRTTRNLNGV
jgi:hypothetical protein